MERISLENTVFEEQSTDTTAQEETTQEEQTEETQQTEETTKETQEEEQTSQEETQEETSEEQQSEEPDKTVIEELTEFFGYEMENNFEDDVDGLKSFTSEVAKQIAAQEIDSFYQQYPEAKEFNEYLLNGGDPEKFYKVSFEEPNYDKIELSEDNDIQSKEIIKAFYKKQGFEEAEVLDMIKDYEDTGILYKQAQKALPKIAKAQKESIENLKKEQKEQAIKQQEETKQAWKNIEQTINKGDLNGITIPEAEKKNFFEWMAVPNEEGKSAMQAAEESMTLDQMLAFRYLLYKGGNISNLVGNTKKTQTAESLRKRLASGNNNKLRGSNQVVGRSPNTEFSLDAIL